LRRLATCGEIRTCHCSQVDHGLYERLRAAASEAELCAHILRTIEGKEVRQHNWRAWISGALAIQGGNWRVTGSLAPRQDA